MKNFKFYELLYRVLETYFDFLLRNKGERYALARTADEFVTVCNEGILEELIVYTVLGEILITHKKVFIGYINRINSLYSQIQLEEFEKLLNRQEYDELAEKIERVKRGLEKVKIEYNPKV